MSYEAGLGRFALLPRELRDLIWQQLDSEDGTSRTIVSKAVDIELSDVIRSIKLEFIICGSCNAGEASVIYVQDQYKSCGLLQPKYQTFSARDPAQVERFLGYPYHRIRETVVRIEPPSEPGDLLRCWNSLVWFVDFWARAKPLHCHLRIAFEEKKGREWSRNGAPTCSLLNKLKDNNAARHADIRMLLQPLHRLRDTTLSIDMPPSMGPDQFASLRKLSAIIEDVVQAASPYGDIASPYHDLEEMAANEELADSAW